MDQTRPMEITLNSMTGLLGVSSIRLVGRINGKEVSFLVDYGKLLGRLWRYPKLCGSYHY